MSLGYKNLKKKIIIETLLKCLIIGISLGLICFGCLTYVSKKIVLDLESYIIILGSVIGFVLGFSIVLLILFPTEKKIAKRIDKDLKLNEKVQTMLAYKDNDKDMAIIQRNDTHDILNNFNLKNFVMKFGIVFLLIPLFSVGVAVTAFAIPKEEEFVTETVDPTFEMDAWYRQSILDIIDYVLATNIDDSIKQSYINLLNTLLDELDATETESVMISVVLKTVEDVNNVTLDNITGDDISMFIGFEITDEMDDLEKHVIELSNVIKVADSLSVSNLGSLLLNDIIKVLTNGNVNLATNSFHALLGKKIESSKTLDKEDDLYLALYNLSNDLLSLTTKEEITDSYNRNYVNLVNAVKLENSIVDVNDYINIRLKSIFGILDNEDLDDSDPNNKDPEYDSDNKEDEEDEDDGDIIVAPGGFGTGETILASDDVVYDPEKGTVVYADVIAKYEAYILQGILDGTISEEYAEYFYKYFDALYGQDEEEGE